MLYIGCVLIRETNQASDASAVRSLVETATQWDRRAVADPHMVGDSVHRSDSIPLNGRPQNGGPTEWETSKMADPYR